MYAEKLQAKDEIRVIAPSESLSAVRKDIFENALEYLRGKGYKITFSRHSEEIEYASTASIKARVEDLHTAFSDRNVKAILTANGGFHVNQILEYIDYSLIARNPKIISGYSDITALLNAIYAKTGVVTYHGPHFSTFGYECGREYTAEYFLKCAAYGKEYRAEPSFGAGEYKVIQEGSCEGTIIGGNLCTFNLLQGTEYMPKLEDVILFLEDDNIMGDYFIPEFERNLQSLLQTENSRIKGIVFGRFTQDCKMDAEAVARIVKDKRQLRDIPILFNADFGHVFPMITFPIGGTAGILAKGDRAEITIYQDGRS